MTKEEFLQKWAGNVLDLNDRDDVLNEILHDEDIPHDERLNEVCALVVRRNVVDMLTDLGEEVRSIEEAVAILRGMYINSAPIRI